MEKLPKVNKDVKMTLFDALQKRASSREFSAKKVDDATLSQLLWAADGINRPDEKKLTAPSAMNYQSVSLYVIREEGAYLWHRDSNALEMVSNKDLRLAIINRQPGIALFPVAFVMVTDNAKFDASQTDSPCLWGALDVSFISQNINLACTALGLHNVPRVNMDAAVLRKELKLSKTQFPVLNNIVGWA